MSRKMLFKLDAIGGNDLDCVEAFVIRADSESEARVIAATQPGDEGADFWKDPTRSSCEIVSSWGLSEVIVRHFRPA